MVNTKANGVPGISDPDFTLLQLQSEIENDEGTDRVAGLRTIGRILMQKQRYAEAVSVYEKLLAIDASAQTQEQLARCLERLGHWPEAVARYQLVLQADPDRPDALAGMALCMLRQGTPPAALTAFERCLRLNPAHLGALLGKATFLRLTGKTAEADAVYRQAARLQPEIESALQNLIEGTGEPAALPQEAVASDIAELENIIASAVSAEDFVTAAERCRTLTELSPAYYEAWFNLGVFEQRNGNLESAAAAFLESAHRRPLALEPLQALAQTYHQMGDMKAAEATYYAALALSPDSPDLTWNLGLVQEQRSDFAGAAQKYSRLVKADQDRGEAWFRLGFARLRLNDPEGAVVAFRRAMDLGTRTLESTYNLGLAYWELGRVTQAADCFRAVLKIQSGFRPAQHALAAVSLKEGDYAAALDLHRELMHSGEASIEILFNLAVLEHRANRLHSAIEFYKQALKINPGLADASAGLALAQHTLSARRYR